MIKAIPHWLRTRRTPLVGVAVAFSASLLAITFLSVRPESSGNLMPAAQAAPRPDDIVARGKYLVTVLGCNDCHTPFKMGPNGPEPDMSRMLSGHPADVVLPSIPPPQPPWGWIGAATNTAFLGPWGTSFASNLTSDEETGIGVWDDKLFIKTIREGKFMGAGRPLMPPMPWPAYGQLTDDDLKAVLAFLHTVPPIKNKVPDYLPPAAAGGGKPR